MRFVTLTCAVVSAHSGRAGRATLTPMSLGVARLLAVVGALALIASTWLAWIDHVAAARIPLWRLVGSHMVARTDTFWKSIGVVLVAAAALGLVAALLPSRSAAFLGGLLSAALVVLLLVQEYRHYPRHLHAVVVGAGVWCAAAGAVVLLVASAGLRVRLQRDVLRP